MSVETGFEAEQISVLFERFPQKQDRLQAMRWAAEFKKDFRSAWSACPRGSWLLWLAWNSPLDRRLVAAAASDCALIALQQIPHYREFLRPLLMTLRAWARGSETREKAIEAVSLAVDKADHCRRLAQESTSAREQNLFLLYALAARCVARVAEDIVLPGNNGPNAYWPTTASLALSVYDRAKRDVSRNALNFDRKLAEAIRSRISTAEVPEMIGVAVADSDIYLEVGYEGAQQWEQFEAIWLAVGKAKLGEALDADDRRWLDFPGVSRDNFDEFSVVLERIRDGQYRFSATETLGSNIARLNLEEVERPLSNIEELLRFIGLFGLRLRAIGDGITRRLLQ